MSENIKLNYADPGIMAAKGAQALGANAEALRQISSVLSSAVHIGVVGQSADQLVGLLFKQEFQKINDAIQMLISTSSDGVASIAEIDALHGSRFMQG